MENLVLKCPSCSGQMILTEAKPGDKIAKCQYCDTIVDLPDAAEKQGFDLSSFFKGFNLDGIANGTHTTTTTTVIIKDGKVQENLSKEELDQQLETIKQKLRNKNLRLEDFDDLNG